MKYNKVIILYFIVIIDCTSPLFFQSFFTCIHKNTAFEADKKKIPRNRSTFQSTKIMKDNLVHLFCFIFFPKFGIKVFYCNRVHM